MKIAKLLRPKTWLSKLSKPTSSAETSPRPGGQWQSRVKIAADFDTLPHDIAAAFGMDDE